MPFTSGNESSIAIAIVGLSCRFPGDASSPSKFWEMLKNGRNGFSPTTDRYNAEAFHHPTGNDNRQNVIPTKGGYFLKQDPYVFDAAFFNITAAEAMALDPKQRIAMEVAYEALENAGMPLQKVAGTQTACFMGSSMSDYRDAVARDFAHFPKYHILGVSDEMISNRISHFLDIHGPSATIQTACSSSLVATHLACQSLRSGESNMAIAGGIGLIIGTDGTMHLNNLGFLSQAGHSRSFDENASGYGRGEGCGVLVLKRLDTAIRDGDTIRTVIRASGVNSDGWTQGVTMPSMDAQAALIKYVYESNGLDYGSTEYVEAHGTGTKVGDPVETGAIHRTIGQTKSSSRKRLYVGSVKPNIGHLEAAAGVASIIKGVLALEHGLIPPNVNFSKANPAIPLDEWNMVVPTKLTPWPAAQIKRMSVSGFGMGGTNAHIVMETFNDRAALGSSSNGVVASRTNKKRLFVFSSHDKAGFKRVGKALVEHLDTLGSAASSPAYLANLAHTLALARSGLAWKETCFAENAADLREQLLTAVGEKAARAPSSPPRIGFVFTGQGAQWARMGIEMLERRVFSDSVARSTSFLKEMGCDWDPVTELAKGQKNSRLGVPEISQPICSVLQIALVDELRSWGVTPSKVVGHSSGEIAAAYTIGALSHRDALAAAYFRGTASAGLSMKQRTGGMMAVGCSRDEAQKLMMETKLQATVACINSPSNITLSGDAVTLEALRAIFEERDVFARRLKVDVAYHSSHMHLCSAEYYASIADLGHTQVEEAVQQQPIITVSSVTGSEVDPELLVPYYWVRNLISPVLLTDAVKELVSPADADGEKAIDLLLEVGPHSALGGPVEQILSSHGIKNVDYQSVLTRGQSALDTSLSLAAELFRQGVPINVSKANGDSNCRLLTDLPPYPWNHSEKFRADSRMQRELAAQQFPTKSLIGALLPRMDESERVWRSFIALNDEPWLRSHMVGTTVLFPGAGMVSIVLEAAQQIVDPGKTPFAFKLRDISFLAAMALPEDMATEITVHMRPHLLATSGSTPAAWWEFTVSSCAGPAGQLRNNCRGLVSIVYEESRSPHMAQEDAKMEATHIADYRRVLLECQERCPKDFFYDRMAKSALPYGEVFQGVENCHPGPGKTCYEVKLVDIGEPFSKGKLERPFLIHTATLDAVLQGWLGSTCDNTTNNNGDFGFDKPMLPTAIGELEISVDVPADLGYMMPGLCRSHRHGFNEFSANINIFDKDLSKVLLSVVDFRTSPLEMEDAGKPDGEGGVFDVDPAAITSEVHWNYALDVMEPTEISQVVLGADATTTDDRLIQVSLGSLQR
jgi:acyl transferase domain-containing protein